MTKRAVGVDQRDGGFLTHDLRFRIDIDPPLAAALIVERDQADAVRVDTVHIRICQRLGGGRRGLRRYTPCGQHRLDLAAHGFARNVVDRGGIRHGGSSL